MPADDPALSDRTWFAESERLRRRILDTSPHIIYVFDLRARRTEYLSRRTRDVLGFSPEALLESSPLGLFSRVHPEDAAVLAINQALPARMDDAAVISREYRLQDHEGQWRWFREQTAVFQRLASGDISQVIGVVEEVTARRLAEAAARERTALGAVELAVGRVLALDLPLTELLPRCAKAMATHLPADGVEVWLADSPLSAPKPVARAGAATGLGERVGVAGVLEENGPRLLPGEAPGSAALVGLPLLLDNRPIGVLVVAGAPSLGPATLAALELLASRIAMSVHRRRSESEIRRLNAELEQRVRERTEELHRRVDEAELLNRGMVNLLEDLQETRVASEEAARRLEEANAQLDAANQELEAFSYSVSHDLRAPLRNVTGFVDLLTRGPEGLDEATRHYLEIIGQETRRMDALINDLLEFSRIVRTEMSRERVDMAALALAAWKDLEPDRAGRSVKWELPALPAAVGDARLLRLVWTNLLSNALKYSRPRQPAIIRVGTRPASSPGMIEYTVQDNGVGFDMKYADKLFGVFQRLHSAAEFEGTGIGLANVQRILRRHGGRAWGEGRLGAGATFYFSLPAAGP